MSTGDRGNSSRGDRAAEFDTTHWSIVLSAGDRRSAASGAALETLCRTYWYPLYAFARRRGSGADEAHDLTQEFFAQLLEKKSLAAADPERGRFRAFLLAAFKNFLANEWDKAAAQKRGGRHRFLSLDVADGESRYARQPADTLTPERVYEREWVLTLLSQVLARLRDEYSAAGKQSHFEHLKSLITGQAGTGSYADAARRLETTEGAARVAAHRLRRRYRKLLRAEIAGTLADPADVDNEIRNLFTTLGSG